MIRHSSRRLFLSVALLAFLYTPSFAARPAAGPGTFDVLPDNYNQIHYVSETTGSNENGDGSKTQPWKTIQHALTNSTSASKTNRLAIFVAAGIYNDATLNMKPHVDCYGGFDLTNWQRNIFKHKTILDGSHKYRILIGANHARLDGFIIRAGKIRGRGAALLCDGTSPTITNNRFVDNRTQKPKNWSPKYWHELANDGAAIFSVNGAKPIIRHNTFANNRTEIGRGAAIAMHGHCAGEISHCVFLDNATGTEDLDRSSDGGAISVFDWSSPKIANNILLENKAFNKNDGGGIFVALWSSPQIVNNIFVGNRSTDDGGALFVGGQEHRYGKPFDPLPNAQEFNVEILNNAFFGNENRGLNSGGIRLTMQARATVQNNILAHDARFQIQNCQAIIANNTILENTTLEEMPQHTAANLLDQNIFWARLHVRKKGTKIPNDAPRVGQQPHFLDDQKLLTIESSSYDAHQHFTILKIKDGQLAENQLSRRVVRFQHRWGVVKSNSDSQIAVWGDVTGYSKCSVLPTFQLHPSDPDFARGPKQLVNK